MGKSKVVGRKVAKKGGKESAILTHVISGLFKSPRLVSSRSQSSYRMTPPAVAQEKLCEKAGILSLLCLQNEIVLLTFEP